METPINLISSIPRCSDTTDESIANTLDETVNDQQNNDSPIERKLPERNESPSAGASPKLVAVYSPVQPYKEFVTSDLKHWVFTYQDVEYTARHSPTDVWIAYFSQYADLAEDADWTDMEDRADLLIQLWEFCAAEKITFPLTEKLTSE